MQTQSRTAVQLRTPRNDAKFRSVMADYWPRPRERAPKKPVKKATSVRLSPSEKEQIEFLAKLWTAMDRAAEVPDARKWKTATVIERFLRVGLDGFYGQIGGFPATETDRQAVLRRASEVVKRVDK